MEITGAIHRVGEITTVGKDLKKCELILTTTDKSYPQFYKIEFIGDKSVIPGKFTKGQHVTVGINLRGRLWTDKDGNEQCFNSINGWRIQELQEETAAPQTSQEDSDLPF